jgi:hypothetical protein
MTRSLLIAVVVATLSPGAVLAWGLDGHRIVCEIAWQEMGRATRGKVLDILPDEVAFSRFSEACVWADTKARDESRYSKDTSRHFVNVERGDTQVQLSRHCPDECVVEAITLYSGILQGEESSERTARDALMFLGHFVGDIHQPLHAGYGDDRGGNSVSVSYYGRDPNCRIQNGRRKCEYQLHRLWDSLLVGGLVGRERTWEEYAQELQSRITDVERTAWTASEPLDWANESVEYVADEIYPFKDGQYAGAAYLKDHGPTVEERLQKAGVRLAHLLEQLLE